MWSDVCPLHQREAQPVIEISWSSHTAAVFAEATHCFKRFWSVVYEWCIVHVSLYVCLKMKEDADQVTMRTEPLLLLLICCDSDFSHNRHQIWTKIRSRGHVAPLCLYAFLNKIVFSFFCFVVSKLKCIINVLISIQCITNYMYFIIYINYI